MSDSVKTDASVRVTLLVMDRHRRVTFGSVNSNVWVSVKWL